MGDSNSDESTTGTALCRTILNAFVLEGV